MVVSRFSLLGTIGVLGLTAFLLCTNRNTSVARGDEAIHTRVVQEMAFETGTALNPKFFGNLYLNKPPLQFWLSTPFVKLFGDSNAHYRIVPMVAGLLTIVVLLLFSKALYGSIAPGLVAALIALGGKQVLFDHGMRVATMDSLLLFLITFASFLIFRATQTSQRVFLYGAGIIVGFACLTKWVAGLLPWLVFLVFSCLYPPARKAAIRNWRAILGASIVMGTIPSAFIGYHLLQNSSGTIAALQQNITERLLGKGYHNQKDYWLYFRELFQLSSYGTSWLIIFGIVLGAFVLPRKNFIFLFVWAFLPLGLYSVLSSRLPWYYLPASPALWLMAGGTIVDSLKRLRASNTIFSSVAAIIFGILIARPLIENMHRVEGAQRLEVDMAVDRLMHSSDLTFVGLSPKVEGSLALSRRYLLFLNRLALAAPEVRYSESTFGVNSGILVIPNDRFGEVSFARYKSYLCPPSDFKKVHDRFCVFSTKTFAGMHDVGSYRTFGDLNFSYGGFEKVGEAATAEGRLNARAGNIVLSLDAEFKNTPFVVNIKARTDGIPEKINIALNGVALGAITVSKTAAMQTLLVPSGTTMSGANVLTFQKTSTDQNLFLSWTSLRPTDT